MSFLEKLQKIKEEGLQAFKNAKSLNELEKVRLAYLGRKSELTQLIRSISLLPFEERPQVGQRANELKQQLERAFNQKKAQLEEEVLKEKADQGKIDWSLPAKRPLLGHKHLVNQVIDDITRVFIGLGYKVAEGPEIETDYYNFTALNMPPDHPARSLWDTLYIKTSGDEKELLLRTHTSPVQIRVMSQVKPPLFYIVPGRVFRHDVADATHLPMFYQVEGFAVDRDITFGDLKGTLEVLAHEIFGKERKVRFRPSFFPFTEPSAEVDVSCIFCEGEGCRVCKGNGWLEILGAGMIDPNVLIEVGYDPEEVSGFAFGLGVERIAMLKYGVTDIRLFFENDKRFLEQF